jgi:hypothetical protein
VTHFPDRQSSEEIAAAQRLTLRDVASAWSLALLGFAALAAFSLADLACPPDSSEHAGDPAAALSGHDTSSCHRADTDVPS